MREDWDTLDYVMKYSKVSLLMDNPKSWAWKYKWDILGVLGKYAEKTAIYMHHTEICEGDIMFIISCDGILNKEDLSKHRHNVVIHASNLPEGRGWSPWIWQVEQGRNIIYMTMFEATEELDAGNWYLKSAVRLIGDELIDEIRHRIMLEEMDMIDEFLRDKPDAHPQTGKVTSYERRDKSNQELDVNKTLAEQFDKLRVCDNDRFPAWFLIRGKEYKLKIE